MAHRRARKNPVGTPLGGVLADLTLVRVGSGSMTHVLHPVQLVPLCRSGRRRQLYKTQAGYLNCYRCEKLVTMNLEAGREPWQGPRD